MPWRNRIGGSGPSRSTALGVVLLLALATVLRVWRLSAVGFRGDEAVYAGQSALLAQTDGMSRFFIAASRGNSNFLVYQSIVSVVYRVFGVSDLGARLVTATFSIATVLLVFLIGRELYGRRAGFLAGLFIAVSGYTVALGRLALLDATVCFFITLAVYCLLRWHVSNRFGWLAGYAVVTAIAMQAKVTSVLLLEVGLVYIIGSGLWRRLTWRRWGAVLLIGALALTPAFYQIASNKGHLLSFLSASTNRSSGVPWFYYLNTLWSAEGVVLSVILALGVIRPIFKRSFADFLPVLWIIVFVLFLQLYPLKAFNYLLPIIPPLALLAGRSVAMATDFVIALSRRMSRRRPRFARLAARGPMAVVGTAVVALAVLGTQFISVQAAMADEGSAGMREAAYWLKAQGAARAGAMTLSHGSGQYVLSFYGGIDAYPFGRFRIATVVPGGALVPTTARAGNQVPVDWVDYWPDRLISEGRISYLVYNTRPLDDPPEQNQIADTVTERQFRTLIEARGGQLVHTVYKNHEARVYIYRVTKRSARPVLKIQELGNQVVITATGYVANSPLTVMYHGAPIARATADAGGAATVTVPIPDPGQSQYHLSVSDGEGNSASVTGLPSTRILYTINKGVVRVFGSRYRPAGAVKLTYGNKIVGQTIVNADGTFTWSFPLPAKTHSRYRVKATDDSGRTASAIGIPPPSLAFVASGTNADISGAHYLPNTSVKVTYHSKTIGVVRTDAAGAFKLRFVVPRGARTSYQLVAVDPIGRQAAVAGLERK